MRCHFRVGSLTGPELAEQRGSHIRIGESLGSFWQVVGTGRGLDRWAFLAKIVMGDVGPN